MQHEPFDSLMQYGADHYEEIQMSAADLVGEHRGTGYEAQPANVPPCGCACNQPGGFCGGCGHRGCSGFLSATQRRQAGQEPRTWPQPRLYRRRPRSQ